MDPKSLGCAECGTVNCEYQDSTYPEFCQTLKLTEEELDHARKYYLEEENRKVSQVSAQIEAEFYGRYTRVEETVTFAKRMGFHKNLWRRKPTLLEGWEEPPFSFPR